MCSAVTDPSAVPVNLAVPVTAHVVDDASPHSPTPGDDHMGYSYRSIVSTRALVHIYIYVYIYIYISPSSTLTVFLSVEVNFEIVGSKRKKACTLIIFSSKLVRSTPLDSINLDRHVLFKVKNR